MNIEKLKGSLASPVPYSLLLLLCFFGSGCAALIYEIVWFQLLQLIIGSTAISLAVLLQTFMGGMCLGSLILPRMISPRWHPLRVYALLELGIGLTGIFILLALPEVVLWRSFVATVCLLPPTVLMGATLPIAARWFKTNRRGISWMGFLYGGNIAGAMCGCLLAGFYILRIHDTVTATIVAAAINGIIAFAALALSILAPRGPEVEIQAAQAAAGQTGGTSTASKYALSPVYVAIALSGLTALGAEVVWTRLLSLIMGGTVYTFSIILAVFLFGLGIGSGIGSIWARKSSSPSVVLGWCQWLLTVAVAWSAYSIVQSLPYWPPAVSINPWLHFRIDLERCLWALLPATVLWGMSFPLALAAAARHGRDPARLVGGIYAANTLGGILGAVNFSLNFIPLLGSQQCQRLLIGFSTAAALLMLVPLAWAGRGNKTFATALRIVLMIAILIFFPVMLARSVPKIPGVLVAYGRQMLAHLNDSQILYVGEGMDASVAVSLHLASNVRVFHVSGKAEASTDIHDMRLQRMMAFIPALIHPHPGTVLVVGCGAGVTAGAFVTLPDTKKIVICERELLVVEAAARYFDAENYGVVNDPRTRIICDDARHYILTTRDKFDIITSDPIHPWVKGSATLYTKEYFEMVKAHLNPGGLVTQWVPLYETDLSAVKSEIATFFQVFPDGTIWANNAGDEGYDLVLLGQAEETKINLDQIDQTLEQPGFLPVVQSLQQIGFTSARSLFGTYASQARDLAPWLKDAQINSDRNLRLQYLAGLWSHQDVHESFYKDVFRHRKFPDNLFVGTNDTQKTRSP